MPRHGRIVIPNVAYHVTQRGNYGQKIFNTREHYKQYCEWIDEYAEQNSVNVLAYCLMNNHVHFVVKPKREDGLANLFKTVHMRYSHYINRQRGAKGHLWQGRFYSCILDNAHLYRAIRYVENNPVRAKITKKAWDYKWSSAKEHVEDNRKPLINISKYKNIKSMKEWKEYLTETDDEMVKEIRLKTNRGLVVGTDKFIKKLESKLNRSLKCIRQGRPRKNK
ncbi:transposase [bacterium]|nr:transposase [bacterium]